MAYSFELLMPPPRMTLAKLKSWFLQHNLHTSTLSGAELSWQMMWHGFIVKVVSLKHRPSHQYLDMRQECRIFKSRLPPL